MGDYTAYVMGAWGVSALVLGGLAADTLLRARRWRQEAQRRDAEPGR